MENQRTWLSLPWYISSNISPPSCTILTLYGQDIEFLYNTQHDCHLAKCVASGVQPVMQERLKTWLTKSCIEHRPIDCFIINTHAFHNAHRLRASLPRSLIAPVPLFADRLANHIELAARLRTTKENKRIAAKVRAENNKLAAANDAEGSMKRKRAETLDDVE